MSFVDRYGPWALVLGASEGLGRAWADGLASRGLNLVVVARRLEPLERAAAELREAHGVEVRAVPLDLAVDDLGDQLEAATDGIDLGLVVYNATASVIGPFLDLSEATLETTVAVNVRGVLLTAHRLAPKLVARGRGGLVLMSSMSGFQGTAMVGPYAATKAFTTVFGESLWEELRPHGVHVMVCVAGATNTPNFLDQTPERRRAGAMPMAPEAVVREALAALEAGRGPTFIPGAVNRWVDRALSLLPRARRVRFISAQTRKMYEAPE